MSDCDKPQAQDAATRKAITLTFTFLKERGVDQNRVAERLGVGHQIISMVKNGKRPASMRQIEALSQLAQDALQAEPLDDEEFVLAEELTLAWWHAITAQIHAVEALRQHVSQHLITLQQDGDLTPEDLARIALYTADAQKFYMGLRRLVQLGQAWQVVATRLVQTWKRIKAEKYLDGPPRQNREETQPKPLRRRGQGKRYRPMRA
jgi:transcriptional regulator with XRE-family HTH domain